MNHPVSKLLSVLLIFLLGLSPLQSLLASVELPFDQHEMPCHTSVESANSNLISQPAMQDCDQCETASSCNDSCCSYGHCASHAAALLPGISTFHSFASGLSLSQASTELKTLQPPALFRPPRS